MSSGPNGLSVPPESLRKRLRPCPRYGWLCEVSFLAHVNISESYQNLWKGLSGDPFKIRIGERDFVYLIEALTKHALGQGGFSGPIGGRYRADATAWAAIALSAAGAREDLVESARSRLAANQSEDGRVSLSQEYPQVFWPSPLAAIAWKGSQAYHSHQSRAITFLLSTTGEHYEKKRDDPIGHDPSIKGWPWIAETHSWVEPTSFVLLALETTGSGDHVRAQEARSMLLDRQLEHGGWNYGNTRIFDQPLRPMPLSTGLALCALAGRVQREAVEKSLFYLIMSMNQIRTPLSLGWGILGLSAWGERPADVEYSVERCFQRQKVYGPYETQTLGLLVASLLGREGLPGLIRTH